MTGDQEARDELALEVHTAAAQVAGVVALGSGRVDQIATYLPGSTVAGVEFAPGVVTIEVVGAYPPESSYMELAGAVRARVAGFVPDLAIDVVVCDIRTEA